MKLPIDAFGNKIIVKECEIFLSLSKESRWRLLGRIDKDSRTLVVERTRNKHLHRKLNAYGYNYYVLSRATTFDTVMLIDDHRTFTVPVQKILEKGIFNSYREQGFELQIFLPLHLMGDTEQISLL